MYLLIPIIIVLFFVLFLSYYHRKKQAVQKVGRMSYAWKCDLLNELAVPFGFSYQFVQDIFTFRDNAWQKEFGYGEFYDLNALSMHMILDCEPVYFNYHGKTWLIEFCKGQYGINTGAEAGIYHADSVVPPALRPQTVFTAAAEDEVLPVKLRLTGPDCPLFSISQKQWRVSGFVMGTFTAPEDLILEAAVTFPNPDMCTAFTRAMNGLGYKSSELLTYQNTVQFYFTRPKSAPLMAPDVFLEKYRLLQGDIFCELFLWLTNPFFTTVDRLLYLYYTHPCLFERILCIRMFQKHRRKRQ